MTTGRINQVTVLRFRKAFTNVKNQKNYFKTQAQVHR